ncbi:hypothetical protein CONPUDRAFT_52845, partial [Coniophora puteana RWD-64-598 SS2]
TFGRGTIRRFHKNACGMKRLAARDFEDLVQCAIPVFESVFPDKSHRRVISDLLFELATWHALAKLRLHTDDTLKVFDVSTAELGRLMRQFQHEVCPDYDTCELPPETAARGRRETRQGVHQVSGKKRKVLNLKTYKYHALGDYPAMVRLLGSVDNYTSQLVSSYPYFQYVSCTDLGCSGRARASHIQKSLSSHPQKA